MSKSNPISRQVRRLTTAAVATVLVVAVAGCAGPSAPDAAEANGEQNFQGQTLVMNVGGGLLGEVETKFLFEPFEEKYGVTIETFEGLTTDVLAKVQTTKNNPSIDVVFMANSGFAQGAPQGLFETITEDEVPYLAEIPDEYRFAGDGPDQYISSFNGPVVLAYNTNEIKEPPTSWEDLWDPKYEGKVIVPDMNACCGVLFLLQAAEMAGGGYNDVQPGFEKLATLKPNLVTLYTDNTQAQDLFTSGQAALGLWSIDRAAEQKKAGAPVDYLIPEEGAPLVLNSIGIVNGAPNPELARVFVDFALREMGKPEFYTALTSLPAQTNPVIPEEFAHLYPDEDEMASLWVPDWSTIGPNLSTWLEQWQREIAG